MESKYLWLASRITRERSIYGDDIWDEDKQQVQAHLANVESFNNFSLNLEELRDCESVQKECYY